MTDGESLSKNSEFLTKMKFHIKRTLETLHWRRRESQIFRLDGNYNEILEYIDCRNKLNKIYEQKFNGIRLRSKCDWYEYVEKTSKFFLNLEKSRVAQSAILNITKDEKTLLVIRPV